MVSFTTLQIIGALGVLVSAIVALSGAIAYLHKKQDSNQDKYETSRDESTKVMFDLNGRVNKLEGEKEGVEHMAQKVIDEIRQLERDRK